VLKPGALAYDMMYGPAAQGFLHWAREHGAIGRDGLGMLVEQAAEAFLSGAACGRPRRRCWRNCGGSSRGEGRAALDRAGAAGLRGAAAVLRRPHRAMAVVDPESTTFQRSEAWRIATDATGCAGASAGCLIRRSPTPEARRDRLGGRQLRLPRRRRLGRAGKAWARNRRRRSWRPSARAGAQHRARPPKIVGGSTITQQLAKNLLLSGERTCCARARSSC
jgi:hypothetical protein